MLVTRQRERESSWSKHSTILQREVFTCCFTPLTLFTKSVQLAKHLAEGKALPLVQGLYMLEDISHI